VDLLAQQAPPGYPPGYPPVYPADSGYGQSGYPARQQDYPPPPPDYPQAAPNYAPSQPNYAPPPGSYPQQPNDQPPPQEYAPSPGYAQPQPYPSQPYPQQDAQQPYGQQPYAQQPPQGLSPDQLDQLVAPIALYPDALLAQILAASTFPMQITEADRWRQAQPDAPPQAIADGANAQPWDPSVKALAAFPQVLENLAQNLSWTTELGNAYYNQPQDVFDAVQAMRQRAQAAGNLQSTPQETVTDDQGAIALAPPNPQIVYVPAYNPWTVYGAPVAPYPGFSLADAIGSLVNVGLQFGPGLVMSAFTTMPWGILGWGLSWLGHCLFYDNAGWYPHSETLADWGLPHGGPRYGWGREGYGRGYDHGFDHGYSRGSNRGYDRGPERGLNPGFNRGYDRAGAYGRSGFGDNRGFNRGLAGNRGFAGPRSGFANRPESRSYGGYGQQAYNRMPAFNARSGYGTEGSYRGSGAYGRSQQSYGGPSYGRSPQRPGANSFGRGYNSFRQPQSSVRSFSSNNRAYSGASGFGGNRFSAGSRGYSGFSSHSQRSGGSFGGGHSSFGGSHFGGGGGHFGGGHSFGGGGHSFGGGHSSHSGGGGHGGHGGGGHHH
jgi:hypothetical protein